MSKLIPTYLSVFEQKLEKLKDLIKEEIGKPRCDRRRRHLKNMLSEAKELKYLIKDIKKESKHTCPHCGQEI